MAERIQLALRYTDSPADPFVATELPFIALGPQAVAKLEAAIQHPDTLLFFPLCWQACLVGSRQFFDIDTGRFGPQDMQKVRHVYRDSAQIFLVSPMRLNDLK